ncbi:rhomboid family intramembrane serine protease [Robertmurraya sp. DFI.2.37]|uniref:rhomboid family intramembrane serine protease n=1 Tax=Robertmurraya sp. DFI.2.37 TaxID=3031819 RepID=UPI00124817F6|nr:rhomboid family intramembrane serine protease [Robertmurraya sp. DFI.2.37]MDF1510548.1 rhomboid family intramembrane serine protease [Robertmurraya sp. DFI.2.37]
MINNESYLFWKLANGFIAELGFRIIKLSKEQNELWLEKRENKQAQIIRLLRYDIDWSNWLQQDIERTAVNGERIRKQITRGELQVVNIYVSSYPPVDDYEFRILKPYFDPAQNKTKVTSSLIANSNYTEEMERLEKIFNMDLNIFEQIPVEEEAVEKLKREVLNIAAHREKEEKALFEQGKPFFTYMFVALQVLMFIVLEAFGGSTNTSTLIQFGAKFNPLILEGEWWRFLTPMVLHIGFLHLAMNTLALFYLGTAVEKIFGKIRFLFIYILAGFAGTVASFIFSPNLSAGASGAIFGCFGALLYFGAIYPKLFLRTMGLNIFVVLAINLSFGFTVPGIDNAGHIGGLIGGFLASGIVHLPKKRKISLQAICLALTLVVAGGMLRYGFENPKQVLDETSVLVLAQDYLEKERFTDAYRLLIDFPNSDESSAQYYFLLSFSEIKLEKFDEAEKSLLKAIEVEPNFHEAHYNLALVYLQKQEIAKAKEHAEKAVEINPTDEYRQLLNQFN